MPQCRYCDQPIDHLNVIECLYVVHKTDSDLVIVEETIEERSVEVIHWECPVCEEVLFWRYEDALAFMKKTLSPGIAVEVKAKECIRKRQLVDEKEGY